jgi:hypothetical protein
MRTLETSSVPDMCEQKFSVYGLIPLVDSIHGNLRQAVEFVRQEQWKASCCSTDVLKKFASMTTAQIEDVLRTAEPGSNGNAMCGALMFKRIGSSSPIPVQQQAPAHVPDVSLSMEHETEIPENEAALV